MWGWPFRNAFNLDGVHLDCPVGDDKSKIFDSGSLEGTLGRFEEQFVTAKDLENLSDDLPVMFQCFGEDQDVVQVDSDLVVDDKILEDFVHHGLECCGGIGEAEKHNKRFKQSSGGSESGFPLITFLNADVVVSPLNIEFCVVLGFNKRIDHWWNGGYRVSVADSHSIKFTVILDRTKCAIFLSDKEERRGHRRFRRADTTGREVLIEKGVELLLLHGIKVIDFTIEWL